MEITHVIKPGGAVNLVYDTVRIYDNAEQTLVCGGSCIKLIFRTEAAAAKAAEAIREDMAHVQTRSRRPKR